MDNKDMAQEKGLEKKPLKAYELELVKDGVEALFLNVEGSDKSLMRRFTRKFGEALEDTNKDRNETIKKYGRPDETHGFVLLPPTDLEDKGGLEKYNTGLKLLTEIMEMETELVPPKVWHVEYLDELPISNKDINALIQFGFVYDPDDPQYQVKEEEPKGGAEGRIT